MKSKAISVITPAKPPVIRKDPAQKYLEAIHSKFIDQLGPRDEVIQALISSHSTKSERLLKDITNPANKTKSLGLLCARNGLTSADMANIWKSHQHSSALLQMMNQIPKVAADIAEDSKSTVKACERCGGFGSLESSDDKAEKPSCPVCGGSGLIRKPGDPGARRMMLQAVGLIKGRDQQSVVVNVGSASVETMIDELADNHDDNDHGQIVDITPEPQPDPEPEGPEIEPLEGVFE